MVPDKLSERGSSDAEILGKNAQKSHAARPPEATIDLMPDLQVGVPLDDTAAQARLFNLRRELGYEMTGPLGGKREEEKKTGGVKGTEMGPIETLWDKFVHSRLAKVLGLGAGAAASATLVACANAQPYNGPTETAPVPTGTAVSPTGELVPTDTARPTDTILPVTEIPQIDPTPTAYPLGGSVQESFKKGEYAQGMKTAKGWVVIWAEMGSLQEQNIGGAGNSLTPVPLDGRARVVCVDTKGKGEYAGKVLCPGLDLVNGGLRAIPTSGNWDRNADGPLFIALASSEELVTKGTGTDLVYQVINKYTRAALRYVDSKTGQYVDGEYQVPGGEIKLPEIVPESMNQIPDLSFNMEFRDPQAAYRMLLETVVGDNLKNEAFWQEILGTSTPTVDQLLAFVKGNVGGPENKPYWLPFETASGESFNFLARMGTRADLRRTKPEIDGVYLDGIYSIFFYGGDMKDPAKAEFITKLKFDNAQISMGLLSMGSTSGIVTAEFGLLFLDNRFIYISGSEGVAGTPEYYEYELGGGTQVFRADIDPAIVSAQFLSYLKGVADHDPRLNGSTKLVCTDPLDNCSGGILSESLESNDWVVKVKQ